MKTIITLRRPMYVKNKVGQLQQVNVLEGSTDHRSSDTETLIEVTEAYFVGKSDVSRVYLDNPSLVIPLNNTLGVQILEAI